MINIKNIVRTNIIDLQPYTSARDEFTGSEGVFLDANENPFGSLNRYPDPYQKTLKQKLSKLKSVDPSQIFIGNGSDEIIDLAYRIFCNPNDDRALTFSPTYGMYEVSANINNVELIKLPLNEKFQIDLEQVKSYLTDSNLKLIFICSPNNPIGNIINKKVIEFILTNFKGIVIVDEAYIDFSKTDSMLSFIKKYNNLIICQTFSKAWGLAAARVGVAFADPEIIELYNKVKPPYNVSRLNQEEAINALENLDTYRENINTVIKEKNRLKKELSKFDNVTKIYPSVANFLLVEFTNANQVYQQLIKMKIITRNRSSLVKECLRITIGTPEENKELLNTLKKLK